MGWLTGWSYRKRHTINGTTAGAQTNYPVRINVHRESGSDSDNHVYVGLNCRADYGDIRFTKADGVTELDYWMSSYFPNEQRNFYVEIDSIPASPGTVDIYVYYGKGDATSTSDGDETFTFFDDFTEDRGWTIGNAAEIYIIDEDDCLRIRYRRPSANVYCYRPISGLTDGFELWVDSEYDVTIAADDYVRGWFSLSKDNDGSRHTEEEVYGIDSYGTSNANKHALHYWNGVDRTRHDDDDEDTLSGRYVYRIRKHDTRLEYYCSSTKIADGTDVVLSGIPAIAYVKAWISSTQEGQLSDNCLQKIFLMRVRKWVFPEPTHGAWEDPDAFQELSAGFNIQQPYEELFARLYIGQNWADLLARLHVNQAILGLLARFTLRRTSSVELTVELAIRHPYRLWTNRRYLNGVTEIDELELNDALLEYVIEGVMNDIKSRLINEDMIVYDSWSDITKVPKLIRRATTYGVVASLYSRSSNDPFTRVVFGMRPVTLKVIEDREAQGRAMDYWESRMEKMIQLYLSAQGSKLIIVDTEDEEPIFSMEDIPFFSEDPYKIKAR